MPVRGSDLCVQLGQYEACLHVQDSRVPDRRGRVPEGGVHGGLHQPPEQLLRVCSISNHLQLGRDREFERHLDSLSADAHQWRNPVLLPRCGGWMHGVRRRFQVPAAGEPLRHADVCKECRL